MKIQVNMKRAEDVFDRLVKAYLEERYPFDTTEEPQAHHNLPRN